jgi:hypothetical protein
VGTKGLVALSYKGTRMSGISPSTSVNCPRCKFRIPAEGVEAGSRLCCPKCHMDFLVAGNSLGRDLDEEEDYGLQTPASVPASLARESDLLPPRSEAEEVALYKQVMRDEELEKKAAQEQVEDEEEEEEEVEPVGWHPKMPPPAGLYRSSFVSFFANLEVFFRLSCFAFLLFIALFILDKALGLINVPNMGIASFGAWFGGMMMLAVGGLLCIACFLYAAGLAMSILLDTSNGMKRVDSWPRGFFFDWMLEAGYVAGAIFWSVLPGIVLNLARESLGVPQVFIFAVPAALIFPVTLLAELDLGIFCFPGSPDVWRSPFHSRRAWLDFYLITLPLVALSAGITAYAFEEDMAWLLSLSSLFAAAVWLLYFRVLGRLAWYASGKAETSV